MDHAFLNNAYASIVSWVLVVGGVSVVASSVTACAPSTDQTPAQSSSRQAPADPPGSSASADVELEGAYVRSAASVDDDADPMAIARLEFSAGHRYRLWRVRPSCSSLDTNPDACAETGTYSLAGDQLSMVDEKTSARTAFGFKSSSADATAGGGLLTSKALPSLTVPSGPVGGSSAPVTNAIELTPGSGASQPLIQVADAGVWTTCNGFNLIWRACGAPAASCGGGRTARGIGQGFCA